MLRHLSLNRPHNARYTRRLWLLEQHTNEYCMSLCLVKATALYSVLLDGRNTLRRLRDCPSTCNGASARGQTLENAGTRYLNLDLDPDNYEVIYTLLEQARE